MNSIWTKRDFIDFVPRNNLKDLNLHIEMNEFESAYLCGLIKKYEPKNIIEIGVAAGGTSCIMLEAINEYSLKSRLYSVDAAEVFYRDKSKQCGFQASELFKDSNWSLHIGNFLPEIISEITKGVFKFDFVILDTRHVLPGEVLDFLVVLPFLNPNSIIVLHDINLMHYIREFYNPQLYATNLLYTTMVCDKFYCMDYSYGNILPNIGGGMITSDTYKYIDNVFMLLSMKWYYLPDTPQFILYKSFFDKYYGNEYGDYFMWCRDINKVSFSVQYEQDKKSVL